MYVWNWNLENQFFMCNFYMYYILYALQNIFALRMRRSISACSLFSRGFSEGSAHARTGPEC